MSNNSSADFVLHLKMDNLKTPQRIRNACGSAYSLGYKIQFPKRFFKDNKKVAVLKRCIEDLKVVPYKTWLVGLPHKFFYN